MKEYILYRPYKDYTDEIKERITGSTVDITLAGTDGEVAIGRGILLESGFVLTSATCVEYNSNAITCFAEGYEYVQQIVVYGGMVLSTTPWMIDPVSDIALLGPMHADYHPTSTFELDFSFNETEPLPLFCDSMELLGMSIQIENIHGDWVGGNVYLQSRWPHRLRLRVNEKASNLYAGSPVFTGSGKLVGVAPRFVEGSKIHPGSEAYMAIAHVALPPWAVDSGYKDYIAHYRGEFAQWAPDYLIPRD
jgi:hypothetical protein